MPLLLSLWVHLIRNNAQSRLPLRWESQRLLHSESSIEMRMVFICLFLSEKLMRSDHFLWSQKNTELRTVLDAASIRMQVTLSHSPLRARLPIRVYQLQQANVEFKPVSASLIQTRESHRCNNGQSCSIWMWKCFYATLQVGFISCFDALCTCASKGPALSFRTQPGSESVFEGWLQGRFQRLEEGRESWIRWGARWAGQKEVTPRSYSRQQQQNE